MLQKKKKSGLKPKIAAASIRRNQSLDVYSLSVIQLTKIDSAGSKRDINIPTHIPHPSLALWLLTFYGFTPAFWLASPGWRLIR